MLRLRSRGGVPQVPGLLLVVLLGLAGCAGTTTSRVDEFVGARRLIFPVILVDAPLGGPPTYPIHGYGNTERTPTGALSGGWWHNWGPWPCDDSLQMPMVFRSPDEVATAARLCNRAGWLLIANEPAGTGGDQSNLSPEAVADLVWQAAQFWQGKIVCCNTFAGEWWYVDRVRTVYEVAHGIGSWPVRVYGVHVYNNAGNWQADVVAARYADRAVEDLDSFMAQAPAGSRFLVTEYGVLSRWWPEYHAWHRPEDLLETFWRYEQAFRARPAVAGWAWFSSNDPRFNSSDLLTPDGHLTVLGQAWTQARMVSR